MYFGDGATSSSDFHAGMNFAGVFKIPTVFFCRNNGWAISVPAERQTAAPTFAAKSVAYGIPSIRVDGNDVFAVVYAVRNAVARAARGEGATLIEALTYRIGGHSTSDDPNAYRKSEELSSWLSRDPIARARGYLEARGAWSATEETAAFEQIDQRFREAVAIAERTPKPALQTLFEDVYRDPPWHLVEQREALLGGPRAPEH